MGVTFCHKPPLRGADQPQQLPSDQNILGNSNNSRKNKALYRSDQDNFSGLNAAFPIAAGNVGGNAVQVIAVQPVIAILAIVDVTNTNTAEDGSTNQTAITALNQTNDD